MSVQFGSGASFPPPFYDASPGSGPRRSALLGGAPSSCVGAGAWFPAAPPSRSASAGVPHLSYRLVARRSLFGAPRCPFHAAAGAFGCSRGKHVSIVCFYSQIKKLR